MFHFRQVVHAVGLETYRGRDRTGNALPIFLVLPSSSPFLTSRYKMVQRRFPERRALAILSAKMGITLITLPDSVGAG
jgi:hypothetical protein